MNDPADRDNTSGPLTPELRRAIQGEHGHRGVRALAALDERRVKRYLDFYVVESSGKEYIIEDDLCTCGDFLFRGRECWHILAVRLARETGQVTEVPEWFQDHWRKERNAPATR